VVVSETFKSLLDGAQKLNLLSIGAKEIPICLVANDNIKRFTELLKNIYSKRFSPLNLMRRTEL